MTHLAAFITLWICGFINNDIEFAMYVYQEVMPAVWFIGIVAGIVLVIIELTGDERNI